ncbi:MAG: lipoprotein LpqH [Mycobacterium sp.]|nr:lipoprotein LpqH [Mycobacterium sp.]
MSRAWRRLAAAAIWLGVVACGLPACSGNSGQPAAAPRLSPASTSTTVMVEGDRHTIVSGVDCASSAAQPDATPPESGDLTTRITARDDSSSVTLALSDEKPPSVDSFAISLTVGNDEYQIPYQAPQSANQVQASKEGKSYTVTGTGQGTTPGHSGTRQLTFGIHVTCP